MKTKKIIIWIALSVIVTSCSVFSKQYGISTVVGRDGSFLREVKMEANMTDSLSDIFPYDLSAGWDIIRIDTMIGKTHNHRTYREIVIGKKFKSMAELTSCSHMAFPTPKEGLKKRFRWFYTYYSYTAVYPEVIYKGSVPMENYLNTTEQKFFFQGDMSAYRGMNGLELKDVLDDLESRYMEWFTRTMYEENYRVIAHFAKGDFALQLPAVKDTVFAVNKARMDSTPPGISDVCKMLDNYLYTDYFSKLYADKEGEMDDCVLDEQMAVTEKQLDYQIRFKLVLPGKILTSNTDLQYDGALEWNVNLPRFLTDNYLLSAESRTVNVWAFVVTLGLILFSGGCFYKSFKSFT